MQRSQQPTGFHKPTDSIGLPIDAADSRSNWKPVWVRDRKDNANPSRQTNGPIRALDCVGQHLPSIVQANQEARGPVVVAPLFVADN
jgi:hypothetical protein